MWDGAHLYSAAKKADCLFCELIAAMLASAASKDERSPSPAVTRLSHSSVTAHRDPPPHVSSAPEAASASPATTPPPPTCRPRRPLSQSCWQHTPGCPCLCPPCRPSTSPSSSWACSSRCVPSPLLAAACADAAQGSSNSLWSKWQVRP